MSVTPFNSWVTDCWWSLDCLRFGKSFSLTHHSLNDENATPYRGFASLFILYARVISCLTLIPVQWSTKVMDESLSFSLVLIFKCGALCRFGRKQFPAQVRRSVFFFILGNRKKLVDLFRSNWTWPPKSSLCFRRYFGTSP